jgi:hypothetical protein
MRTILLSIILISCHCDDTEPSRTIEGDPIVIWADPPVADAGPDIDIPVMDPR